MVARRIQRTRLNRNKRVNESTRANETDFGVSLISNAQPARFTLSHRSRDLHNYVEVCGGRLVRPIFQDVLPRHHFDAFIIILDFELANRILIVTFEINVDLLVCRNLSKPMSLHIATH